MHKLSKLLLCLIVLLSLVGCKTKPTEETPTITTVNEPNVSDGNVKTVQTGISKNYNQTFKQLCMLDDD